MSEHLGLISLSSAGYPSGRSGTCVRCPPQSLYRSSTSLMNAGFASSGSRRVHSTKVTEPNAKNPSRDPKSHDLSFTSTLTCAARTALPAPSTPPASGAGTGPETVEVAGSTSPTSSSPPAHPPGSCARPLAPAATALPTRLHRGVNRAQRHVLLRNPVQCVERDHQVELVLKADPSNVRRLKAAGSAGLAGRIAPVAYAIISAEASTPTTPASGIRAAISAVILSVPASQIQDALRTLQVQQRQHLGSHRLLQCRDPRIPGAFHSVMCPLLSCCTRSGMKRTSTHTSHEVSWHNALDRRRQSSQQPREQSVSSSFVSARLSGLITLLCLLPLRRRRRSNLRPRRTVSLQDTLLHLQENYWDYLSNVPDFFADEHVVSDLKQEGCPRRQDNDRLRLPPRRAPRHRRSSHLHREPRGQDSSTKSRRRAISFTARQSSPEASRTAAGIVSLEMSRCFRLRTRAAHAAQQGPAHLLISYTINRDVPPRRVLPRPGEAVRPRLDRSRDLPPLRVEMAVPNHKDNNGRVSGHGPSTSPLSRSTPSSSGCRRPSPLTPRPTTAPASGSFTATYSNYHKLNVSSRIITDLKDQPTQPK